MTYKEYESMKAKIPANATFDQVKKLFTLEELVGYLMYEEENVIYDQYIKDGDERLVASMIRVMAEDKPSIKRCTALLEATKEVVGYFQRLEL